MTVYYFEGSPIVAPLTIESNEPIFSADTVNLKQQRVSQGAQRWELSFQIQTKDNEEELLVGMVTGVSASKSMDMPQLNSVMKKSTVTNRGNVRAVALRGSTSVSVSFSQARLLAKGNFIQFTDHSKVYLVTSDVTTLADVSNVAQAVSVPIYPALTVDLPTSAYLHHSKSPILAQISYYRDLETLQGIIYEDGVLVNPGTIRLLEAL